MAKARHELNDAENAFKRGDYKFAAHEAAEAIEYAGVAAKDRLTGSVDMPPEPSPFSGTSLPPPTTAGPTQPVMGAPLPTYDTASSSGLPAARQGAGVDQGAHRAGETW